LRCSLTCKSRATSIWRCEPSRDQDLHESDDLPFSITTASAHSACSRLPSSAARSSPSRGGGHCPFSLRADLPYRWSMDIDWGLVRGLTAYAVLVVILQVAWYFADGAPLAIVVAAGVCWLCGWGRGRIPSLRLWRVGRVAETAFAGAIILGAGVVYWVSWPRGWLRVEPLVLQLPSWTRDWSVLFPNGVMGIPHFLVPNALLIISPFLLACALMRYEGSRARRRFVDRALELKLRAPLRRPPGARP
jgi:hypothetical protein